MNYFTSDIHFCDEDTMIQNVSPFSSIKKYDKYSLKSLRRTLKKGDTLYVVGDLLDCDGPEYTSWKKALTYVPKIKADIILIMGNNEERILKYFFDGDFEKFRTYMKEHGIKEMYPDLTLSFGGQQFLLTHEPINHRDGYFTLFGHIHRRGGLYHPYGLNISFDLHFFKVLSEKDILFFMEEKREFWDKDDNFHHV